MALTIFLKAGSLFAIGTGMADVFLGSKMVETHDRFPLTTTSQIFADSQIRYFGAMWACWGAMMWWASNDVLERRTPIDILSAFMVIGGVGRVIGGIRHGFKPDIVLPFTIIELVVPPAVWLML